MKRISILGSTGSIGRQSLDVVESLPGRFEVVGLAAGSNIELAAEQILRHRPAVTSVTTEDAWAAAAAYGCDMNLLELSLRRPPAERLRLHQSALDLVEALQAAGRRRNVRS